MEKKTLATEVLKDLKRVNKRRLRIVVLLSAIILVLLVSMVATCPRVEEPKAKLNSEFTTAECEFFRRECNFTDEELNVFNMRVRGKSNVEIAMKLSMSESTVDRRVRAIKRKIIKVL